MLYVTKEDGKIYTFKNLLLAKGVMRSQLPRQEDLDAWNVAELQPDVAPIGDVTSEKDVAILSDGVWKRSYDVRSFTANELSDYKEYAIDKINVYYQDKIDSLTEKYPDFTKDTFFKQAEEAKAWLADSSYETPFIDRVLQFYTVGKSAYCNGVITKLTAYYAAVGKYVGLQMEAKDMINASTTRASIDAVIAQVIV